MRNVPNLVRYQPSGKYYLRPRIAGKLVFKALDTEVFTTAKLRLPDKLAELKRQLAVRTSEAGQDLKTFGDCEKIYSERVEKDISLKPSAKKYRLNTIKVIYKL